ncbi:MAG: UDP-phosphate N-acetylgalactosaminyl-1-phosphate transferase [Candidatus Marinimicrobia bacterium]|nr:UDP-phosphate N-acetylgalactosaminyl-1-phosphate transferase [Candidatus Neomarinimicrobiota bacterium]|tara:strand:- start:2092 stop:2676 length:585 start_codon:yes stop_codon:yes gene_type:complete
MNKRFFDLFFIFLFSPVIILIIVLIFCFIKISQPKYNAFYVQQRVGKNGILFRMYKFRTMLINMNVGDNAVTTTENDVRITKLGKFLRKHRLDEFPQFINVLIGNMSIVGPRPEQEKFVKKLSKEIPKYMKRHNVKPGITGLAQIKVGYTSGEVDEVKHKLKYDLEYINDISILNDIYILFKSISVILFGFGSR